MAAAQQGNHRNTVFFPGWRSHAELPRFYAHAGAFVHPAISEPWGLVVNEAMPMDIVILTHDEREKQLKAPSPIASTVAREGISP